MADNKAILIAAVAAVGLGVGGYFLGTRQGGHTSPVGPNAATASPNGAPDTHTGVIQRDHNARFTHFRVGMSNVKRLLNEGKILWVGTSKGVVRYDTSTDQYKLYDNRNGLLSNGIFSLTRMDDGRLAIGTYGGGLTLLDEKTGQMENINVPDGLADAFVYDVLKRPNGDWWIATWSGANVIKGGKWRDRSNWETYTVENTKGGLINDWVYGLAEGRNGEVWLATEGGLVRYMDGKWDNWNHQKGQGAPFEKVKDQNTLDTDPSKMSEHHARQKAEMGLQNTTGAYNPNYIVSLVVDRDGSVWAGTWGAGLAHFDGAKWTNYTVSDGLPGNHVFMLHLDKQGRLWVGTNKGLTRRENGTFVKAMTTQDGLFANDVFSMAIDDGGALWLGSFGGVTYLRQN